MKVGTEGQQFAARIAAALACTCAGSGPGQDMRENRPTGTCRVRNCASTTTRPRGACRTIALPGTPREERSGAPLPAQMEAVARASSVVADDPATNHATTLLVRRWDAGTPSASQKAGAHRIRVRGSVRGSVYMVTPGCSDYTRSQWNA
jgi:hypothetical protein